MWTKLFIYKPLLLFLFLHFQSGGVASPSYVIVEGIVVTYVEKAYFKVKKNQIIIDVEEGMNFFFHNEATCSQLDYSNYWKLEYKKNYGLFFRDNMRYGRLFFNYKNDNLDFKKIKALDRSFYPTKDNFSKKFGCCYFKCTKVRLKCKVIYLSKKELKSAVEYDETHFSIDSLPAYFVYDYKVL